MFSADASESCVIFSRTHSIVVKEEGIVGAARVRKLGFPASLSDILRLRRSSLEDSVLQIVF